MRTLLHDNKKQDLTSYLETHFCVVDRISQELSRDRLRGKVLFRYEVQGRGGVWELAQELTNKFEDLHKDTEWDGEFIDEIEKYLDKELA